MAFYATGTQMAVKVYCKAVDQIAVNTHKYAITAYTPLTRTEQQVTDAISLRLAGFYKSLLSSQATFFGIEVLARLAGGALVPIFHSTNGAGAGSDTGSSILPRQSSGLVSLGTGIPGRAHRGRRYIPFPGSGYSTTDGHPSTTYTGYLGNLGVALVGDTFSLGATGTSMTVKGQLWHSGALGDDDLTTSTARPKYATQRRRGDYGRTNADPF